MPTLHATPTEALQPTAIALRGEGFPPGERVTLRSTLTDDAGVEWNAHGVFVADSNGVVDLADAPSEEGTFTGVDAAGLFWVMLGFGSVPDSVAVGHTPLPPTYSPVGSAVPKRSEDLEASDDGQYGLAFRFFAPKLGDTEFGLYFLNYHSRLPLIGARTGTASGLFAGNYAATADYFLIYPEDIKLYGASFITQLARTGIALQGEVTYRHDVPLQADDVELLYAALSPLRLLPPLPQLAPLIGLGTLLANTNQLGAYGFSQQIDGWRRFDTTQFQITGTKAFSQILGADQVVLVGEGAWSAVHDLPDRC